MALSGTKGLVVRVNKCPFIIMHAQMPLRTLCRICLVYSMPAACPAGLFYMMMVTWEEEEMKGTGNHAAFSQSQISSMHGGRPTDCIWELRDVVYILCVLFDQFSA